MWGLDGAFLKLFHHRWTVPILAELHRLGGAKFVTLASRLGGLSPDSLSRTLAWLGQAGWVVRNPGYGHPLRPEYVLTPLGAALGAGCTALFAGLQSLGVEAVGLRKWAMPAVCALCPAPLGFTTLKKTLGKVTPRALTQTLRELEGAGLVVRVVPGGAYDLTAQGRNLCRALAELRGALGRP